MILRALPRDNTLNQCFEDVAQGILFICVGVAPKQAPQRLRMFLDGPTRPGVGRL
jgi:hypothetical protein